MEIRKKIIKENDYVFSESEVEYIKIALDHALWSWQEGVDEGIYNGDELKEVKANLYIVGDIYEEISKELTKAFIEKEQGNDN